MKASQLLKKVRGNQFLVDAPVLLRAVLEVGTEQFDRIDSYYGNEARIVKRSTQKEVLAAVQCLCAFVRRECGFGGSFDIDADMLASGNYEPVLLVEDLDYENVFVVGLVLFTRLRGDLVRWELSAAYLLPALRLKGRFSRFIDLACWRYGRFVVQPPLSARMAEIAAKHKAGDIGPDPYFGRTTY